MAQYLTAPNAVWYLKYIFTELDNRRIKNFGTHWKVSGIWRHYILITLLYIITIYMISRAHKSPVIHDRWKHHNSVYATATNLEAIILKRLGHRVILNPAMSMSVYNFSIHSLGFKYCGFMATKRNKKIVSVHRFRGAAHLLPFGGHLFRAQSRKKHRPLILQSLNHSTLLIFKFSRFQTLDFSIFSQASGTISHHIGNSPIKLRRSPYGQGRFL